MAQRILAGVAAELAVTLTNAEGSAAAASGAVTVEVVRADGTVLLPAGSSTTNPAVGEYRRALTPAQAAELDELTARWNDAGDGSVHTTRVEVVGAYYFSVAQARSTDPSLGDAAKYPTAAILAARQEVEEEAERICGQAFVPRFRRVTLAADGGELELPDPRVRRVQALTAGSTVVDPSTVTLDGRMASGSWAAGRATVAYEHGWDAPPADLRRAALARLRQRLNQAKSGIPERAESWSAGEGGTFRLAMPGPQRTGSPEIDAVYARYTAERIPGIA